ncbi:MULTISPECIES: daptide-type RiPP [Microbacterium]|nr:MULTISPECIES: daptide-type RiPP [unclassified Microbacterium]
MTNDMDLLIEELPTMDAPSEWSDFVNGVGMGIAIVVIAAGLT